MPDDMREQLAALMHEQWRAYMDYHLAKFVRADGYLTIPYEYYQALKRLIALPYAELSETEKDGDREEADKVLAIIGVYDGD